MENYEMHKKAKKEAKKVVSDAKLKAYDNLYNGLGTREWKNDVFKLAKMRERKSRDLDHAKCIKSNDQKALVKDNDIKEGGGNILAKFRGYFVSKAYFFP